MKILFAILFIVAALILYSVAMIVLGAILMCASEQDLEQEDSESALPSAAAPVPTASAPHCAWCRGADANHPLRGLEGLLCDECYYEEIMFP